MWRKFSQSELRAPLLAIDSHLEDHCSVCLVGGAAIALVYHSSHATADLDFTAETYQRLTKAMDLARKADSDR